jgi:hypothetical protein
MRPDMHRSLVIDALEVGLAAHILNPELPQLCGVRKPLGNAGR